MYICPWIHAIPQNCLSFCFDTRSYTTHLTDKSSQPRKQASSPSPGQPTAYHYYLLIGCTIHSVMYIYMCVCVCKFGAYGYTIYLLSCRSSERILCGSKANCAAHLSLKLCRLWMNFKIAFFLTYYVVCIFLWFSLPN